MKDTQLNNDSQSESPEAQEVKAPAPEAGKDRAPNADPALTTPWKLEPSMSGGVKIMRPDRRDPSGFSIFHIMDKQQAYMADFVVEAINARLSHNLAAEGK